MSDSQDMFQRAAYPCLALKFQASHYLDGFSTNLNPDTTWTVFKNMILDGCVRYTPETRFPTKPTPKWFIATVRHQLNCTRTSRRKAKRHQSLAKLAQMENAQSSSNTQVRGSHQSNKLSTNFTIEYTFEGT